MAKLLKLLTELGVNEKFTTRLYNTKNIEYNSVKDNIPLVANYNMMADLLFLPTAKFGFKYLFVIVDLATDLFDIEPVKNKEPITILKAMKKCFAREYLNEPEYTLKTDGGNEFKGVFHKYLYDESILHKVAPPSRHTSMANVESLNKQLGRLFNGYMNMKEERTGKVFKNWTEIIPIVREKLNEIRKKPLPKDINSHEYPIQEDLREKKVAVTKKKVIETQYTRIEPAFKVGDSVYRYLDHPQNALKKNQPTAQKRMGDYLWDRQERKILKIITMGGKGPLYRYLLEDLPNVSFTEKQLMKA
jgi:hypothetical protein